jgi:hypothetical protein
MIVKGARTVLAAGAILTANLPVVEAKDISIVPRIEQMTRAETLSEQEVDLLVLNVFYEARGESLKGQLAQAQSTIARLLSGKHGKTLQDVILEKNAYSWTREDKSPLTPKEKDTFENMRAVLSMCVGGKPLGVAIHELAKQTGLPLNTLHYKSIDLDENNPDEKRMSENSRKFFRSLLPVGIIDKHGFYAERERVSKR